MFDYAYLSLDGEPQGSLTDYQLQGVVIGGKTGWTNVVFDIVEPGEHTVRWTYKKDEVDESEVGEDCVWLDEVTWTSSDPLPDVTSDAETKAVLSKAGDEVRLKARLSTAAAYTAFRSWVDGKGFSHALVKDAPNAWLSYVLDAPGLMAKNEPLVGEDVVIESIAPSAAAGTFDIVVNIADAEIGEDARLAEALGVEGASGLDESAFSSDNVSVTLERTADGKARFTVTRRLAEDGSPHLSGDSFFMRVMVK